MVLTDNPFKGVLCFKTVKSGYPRSWIRPTKDNWFLYSEGPWGLFRPFIPRCLTIETSVKMFLDITFKRI